MRYEFESVLSLEMRGYLQLQIDAGKSAASLRSTLNEFDRFLVERQLREKALSEQVVTDFIAGKNITAATKANIIGHLRGFSRYLASLKIYAEVPDAPIYRKSYSPYIFSDAEFSRMIRVCDSFEGNIKQDTYSSYVFPVLLRILYGCGLRLSEGLNLRFCDINLETGVIAIEIAKNNKQRRVPMNETLKELLKTFRKCCENREAFKVDDYLFASPRRGGKPYLQCSFAFWFGKILEKAEIPKLTLNRRERGICPHCLRHLFVHKSFLKSEAEGRKFDDTVPFLSEFLGHVSLYETEKYLQKDYTLYESSQNRVNAGIGGLFPKVVF